MNSSEANRTLTASSTDTHPSSPPPAIASPVMYTTFATRMTRPTTRVCASGTCALCAATASTVVMTASPAPKPVQAQTRGMSTGATGTKRSVSIAARTPMTTHPQVATPAITAMRLLNSTTSPA